MASATQLSDGVRDTNRAEAWYAFAGLCLAGSFVGALSLVLPAPETANIPALWANTSVAFVTSLVAIALGRRGTPLGLTHPFVFGGTLLIGNAAFLSGDGTTFYSAWFVWIVLHAYSFYERRVALVHLATVAATYAVVLVALDAPDALSRWVTTITTLVIAAVFISRLVRNLRRRAEVVENLMAQLEAAAQTDQLTGLPNRRSWDHELARAVAHARRFDLPIAVAVLDLDGFKVLNDSAGHAAGDAVLIESAQRWSEVVREVDTLARWGGDEFGLIVAGSDADEAAEIVERLRGTTPAPISCSAGLVLWDGVEDEASLMARADVALYAAKRGGRDRLVVGREDALASRR
jgi:diguanylate cyclase (GGDEF)-like protein